MVCEKEEDVEKRKKWTQDEVFVVLGERGPLACLLQNSEMEGRKEQLPSSNAARQEEREDLVGHRSSSSNVLQNVFCGDEKSWSSHRYLKLSIYTNKVVPIKLADASANAS